jgi:hypothetical protein
VRFRTTTLQGGKTATGIEVPVDIVGSIGAGKRPPVRVTINGYTYRSSVVVMRGVYMVGVSAEVRKNADVAGGDEFDIDMQLDTEPREVTVPTDFAAALDGDANPRIFRGVVVQQQTPARARDRGCQDGRDSAAPDRQNGQHAARRPQLAMMAKWVVLSY